MKKLFRSLPGFQCPTTKARFTITCALPTVYECDGVSDCDDATDECFCDGNNASSKSSKGIGEGL